MFAVSDAVTWENAPVFEQVFASGVDGVLVVLFTSVAVAQSFDTVLVHTFRYQKLSEPPVGGAVKVCETEFSGVPFAVT